MIQLLVLPLHRNNMDSSLTFLERISNLLIFCMAISMLYIGSSTLWQTINTLKISISKQQVLFEQALEAVNAEKVEYDEIIGSLMGELTYDIVINDMIINKDDYNPQRVDYKKIKNTSYNKTYVLDPEGNILKIIYDE